MEGGVLANWGLEETEDSVETVPSEETFKRTTTVEELFVFKDQHWRQQN